MLQRPVSARLTRKSRTRGNLAANCRKMVGNSRGSSAKETRTVPDLLTNELLRLGGSMRLEQSVQGQGADGTAATGGGERLDDEADALWPAMLAGDAQARSRFCAHYLPVVTRYLDR